MSLSNPTEAEKAFLAIFNEKVEKSHDTKTRAEHKAKFEKSFGYKTPTKELAERILAAERVIWVPCGYVLFVRQATCKNCGNTERCLDLPRLFLQQRKQRRDESNPYIYTPVGVIEHVSLPRRKIVTIVTTPFCLSCFEGSPSCESSYFSAQVDMQLLTDDLEKRSPAARGDLLREAALSFPPPSKSPAYTNEVEFAGSPSEKVFGLGSREEGVFQPVAVEG